MKKPIYIFIFFGGALIFSIFFTFPKYQEITNLRGQIEEKRIAFQYQEEYLQNLRDLGKKLEDYKEPLEKVKSALPEEPDIPSLFNFLQKAASENGLILEGTDTFSVIPPKTEEELGEVQVAFSVSGLYPSFKNFLNTLEKSARLIELETVSFSSLKEGDIFHFSLNIIVHFLPTRQ